LAAIGDHCPFTARGVAKSLAELAEVAAVGRADVDRPRTKEERLEWFLASIYCTCKVLGERCTGMFYTLASCNPNGCGMPNGMRTLLGKKIDAGMTDR
jgi:hypothetical protein